MLSSRVDVENSVTLMCAARELSFNLHNPPATI